MKEEQYYVYLIEDLEKHILIKRKYDESMEDDHRYVKDYNGYLVDFYNKDYALRWLDKHIPDRYILEDFIIND